jgi:hypothetical protein
MLENVGRILFFLLALGPFFLRAFFLYSDRKKGHTNHTKAHRGWLVANLFFAFGISLPLLYPTEILPWIGGACMAVYIILSIPLLRAERVNATSRS